MRPIEYGIFASDGMLEGSFYSMHEALKRIEIAYPENDVYASLICPRHRCYEQRNCEKCNES